MKEIAEKRRIANKYTQKLAESKTPQEQLMYRSFIMMCTTPTQELLSKLNEDNAILEFRHTFLSNFYAVPVTYKGIEYPSVEYAYQAQKFTSNILASISEEHLAEINEALHLRGQAKTLGAGNDIFTDRAMSSGNIKIIADILRNNNYVRSDWDDDKILLMANLLQEKFKNPEMRRRLDKTGDMYLVEGNTWDDTLWGVSGWPWP